MDNLLKQIIESVVLYSSSRSGCDDDNEEYIEKLNKLAEGNSEDQDRLVKGLGKLAGYGINLEDI